MKWTPGTSTALDATINPDFSQVESDVAQIAVNDRFALFYPEKRPFFLEGVDLFDTPIQAVYTRTITSPRWGGRGTGKLGGNVLHRSSPRDDRGGGSVILPGPTGSDAGRPGLSLARGHRPRAPRPRIARSWALLATGREIDGGGYNRVFGPDFQWRPGRDGRRHRPVPLERHAKRRTGPTSPPSGTGAS